MPAISDATIRQKCTDSPWMAQHRGEIEFGKVPQFFENIADMMPAGSAERQDYIEAAEKARSIYKEQVLADLPLATLDAVKMCADEPWTAAPTAHEVLGHKFGYVTEKLEKAFELFEETTPEHQAYKQAFETGKQTYFASMKQYAYDEAKGKSRAEIEDINTRLWHGCQRYENDGTYRKSRLVSLCHLLGHFQQNLNVNFPTPGAQQFVARGKPGP
ncbi:MAG: hypothetical protein ACK4NR_07450 [Micavibrio sp.]